MKESILTTAQVKDILASKLRDEGTYFTKSHILCRKTNSGYRVQIKDYDHIPFEITFEEEDYFGKCVWIKDKWSDSFIIFKCSKNEYPLFEALLSLGYYIGTRF